MNKWPKPDYASLCEAFGKFDLNDRGLPTPQWERSFLCTVDLPYPMRLSWERETIVRKTTVNQAVRTAFLNCMDGILKHYGSIQKVREAGMDLWGGCYCFRRARGLGIPSVHSWAAAVDLDPDRNELGKKWEPNKGMMPEPVIDIFKASGAIWGGDWKNRPDTMHFQWTQPYK